MFSNQQVMSRNVNKIKGVFDATASVCESVSEKPAEPAPYTARLAVTVRRPNPAAVALPVVRCSVRDRSEVLLDVLQTMREAIRAGRLVCPRCRCFLPRNQAARVHGLRSRMVPAVERMNADELIEGIVADLGGPAHLTTLEKSYARKLADVEITIRLLASSIATEGMFTSGHRVRDVYAAFLAGIDRFDRLAQRLGLERRQRQLNSPNSSPNCTRGQRIGRTREHRARGIGVVQGVQQVDRHGSLPVAAG